MLTLLTLLFIELPWCFLVFTEQQLHLLRCSGISDCSIACWILLLVWQHSFFATLILLKEVELFGWCTLVKHVSFSIDHNDTCAVSFEWWYQGLPVRQVRAYLGSSPSEQCWNNSLFRLALSHLYPQVLVWHPESQLSLLDKAWIGFSCVLFCVCIMRTLLILDLVRKDSFL